MITKIRIIAVLVALGIPSLGATFPATASAAGPDFVDWEKRQQCTSPCTATAVFDPAGGSYSLSWEVDGQYVKTTQCSDVNSAECRHTATFDELGSHSFLVGFEMNGSYTERLKGVDVVRPDDMPDDKLDIDVPDPLTSPAVVTVRSRREVMSLTWDSDKQFQGRDYAGQASVESRFSEECGCWIHTANFHAPKGELFLVIYLANRKDAGDPGYTSASEEYVIDARVERSSSKMFGFFRPRIECVDRQSSIRVRSQLAYMARQVSSWRVKVAVQRKAAGRWRTLARRTREGRTSPDNFQYSVEWYGKAAAGIRGKKFRKLSKASSQNKARVVTKFRVKDPATGKTRYKSKVRRKLGDIGC